MNESLRDLISTYRSTAIAWDAMENDSKKANPLFVTLHGLYKRLRVEQAGRDAISALMVDASLGAGVRLAAATHALGWDQERAVAVLEAIERDGPGLRRVSAKYTLKAHREGTLNLDW